MKEDEGGDEKGARRIALHSDLRNSSGRTNKSNQDTKYTNSNEKGKK